MGDQPERQEPDVIEQNPGETPPAYSAKPPDFSVLRLEADERRQLQSPSANWGFAGVSYGNGSGSGNNFLERPSPSSINCQQPKPKNVFLDEPRCFPDVIQQRPLEAPPANSAKPPDFSVLRLEADERRQLQSPCANCGFHGISNGNGSDNSLKRPSPNSANSKQPKPKKLLLDDLGSYPFLSRSVSDAHRLPPVQSPPDSSRGISSNSSPPPKIMQRKPEKIFLDGNGDCSFLSRCVSDAHRLPPVQSPPDSLWGIWSNTPPPLPKITPTASTSANQQPKPEKPPCDPLVRCSVSNSHRLPPVQSPPDSIRGISSNTPPPPTIRPNFSPPCSYASGSGSGSAFEGPHLHRLPTKLQSLSSPSGPPKSFSRTSSSRRKILSNTQDGVRGISNVMEDCNDVEESKEKRGHRRESNVAQQQANEEHAVNGAVQPSAQSGRAPVNHRANPNELERELNAVLDVDATGRVDLEFDCQCGRNYQFLIGPKCCFYRIL